MKPVFDDCQHKGLDVVETFERMLEKWYEEELFRSSGSDAQLRLIGVIEMSRCSPLVLVKVVGKMQNMEAKK